MLLASACGSSGSKTATPTSTQTGTGTGLQTSQGTGTGTLNAVGTQTGGTTATNTGTGTKSNAGGGTATKTESASTGTSTGAKTSTNTGAQTSPKTSAATGTATGVEICPPIPACLKNYAAGCEPAASATCTQSPVTTGATSMTVCYSDGFKENLVFDASTGAGVITLAKGGSPCAIVAIDDLIGYYDETGASPYSLTYKDGSGKVVATDDYGADGSDTITCAGGSPVVFTPTCVFTETTNGTGTGTGTGTDTGATECTDSAACTYP